MTERCELTDMLVDQCAHCTGRTGEPPPVDLVITVTWEARFPGKCAECGERFDAGDRIGRTTDGDYIGPECLP